MENHCAEIADYISSRPVKSGRDIGYRMSKAALLSQTVTLAQDLQEEGENIVAVFIYPGYLATRLSKFRSKNDITECMNGVRNIIEKLKMEDSNKVLKWKGETRRRCQF